MKHERLVGLVLVKLVFFISFYSVFQVVCGEKL